MHFSSLQVSTVNTFAYPLFRFLQKLVFYSLSRFQQKNIFLSSVPVSTKKQFPILYPGLNRKQFSILYPGFNKKSYLSSIQISTENICCMRVSIKKYFFYNISRFQQKIQFPILFRFQLKLQFSNLYPRFNSNCISYPLFRVQQNTNFLYSIPFSTKNPTSIQV